MVRWSRTTAAGTGMVTTRIRRWSDPEMVAMAASADDRSTQRDDAKRAGIGLARFGVLARIVVDISRHYIDDPAVS